MTGPVYFSNPAGDGGRKAQANGILGYIDTPEQGNKRPYGVLWCADNGLFSPTRAIKGEEWDEDGWWKFLQKHARDADLCAFATAPDVVNWVVGEDGKGFPVGDAAGTLERSARWYGKIRELGYKVALVAQDGLAVEDVPWDDIDALFIGGSDAYKIGAAPEGRVRAVKLDGTPLGRPGCLEVVMEAKRRGKWVHMGRVNSLSRYRLAKAMGCDSVDGTFLTFAPDENLPKLLSWVADDEDLSAAVARIDQLLEAAK